MSIYTTKKMAQILLQVFRFGENVNENGQTLWAIIIWKQVTVFCEDHRSKIESADPVAVANDIISLKRARVNKYILTKQFDWKSKADFRWETMFVNPNLLIYISFAFLSNNNVCPRLT